VELTRLAAEAQAEAVTIASLTADANLISAGAKIDAVREKLGAARKAADDLPRRIEARDHELAQLDDIARRLGLAPIIDSARLAAERRRIRAGPTGDRRAPRRDAAARRRARSRARRRCEA